MYFIYHDDNQGRGEFAAEHIVVFSLCDWDCSSREGPRNSTVGRKLKVFLVVIHYLHCAVNVVMKPVLWMIGNYGARVGKHYDPYALPEFEYFDYRGLVPEEKTMAARVVVGVSNYYFIIIGTLHTNINREAKAKWHPCIIFQNYHVSKEYFPIFGDLCEFGDIQVEDKRMKSVEQSNYICETVFAARLFEGSLCIYKQWNPGDNYSIFNYYCTKRILMQIAAKVVLLVIKFLEIGKGYANSNALMFATTILKSSAMVISWDPGKFNTFMTGVAYQCCLRNSLSIYDLLNLVFDRGKIWLKSILVLLLLVYDRGKFWSSMHLGVQVMTDLTVFHGLIPMCFSSELKGHLAARR
ncbi:putative polygalacturonase-like, partial [Trifolium medium]|nr:putative polygalacturonase-like [Trifolium medium]